MKARQAKRLARSVLTLSLLVVVGAGFSTISSASDAAEKSRAESKSKYHNQIASVVADIVEVNQLASADLSAGSKILVPIQ